LLRVKKVKDSSLVEMTMLLHVNGFLSPIRCRSHHLIGLVFLGNHHMS
jgi:hypothetical protein